MLDLFFYKLVLISQKGVPIKFSLIPFTWNVDTVLYHALKFYKNLKGTWNVATRAKNKSDSILILSSLLSPRNT